MPWIHKISYLTGPEKEGLCRILGQKAEPGEFATRWIQASLVARGALVAALEAEPAPSEPWVLHALPQALPEGATLFIGNSMPVRDLDAFFFSTPKRLRFLANRGASGIDGVVSSALGAAAEVYFGTATDLYRPKR